MRANPSDLPADDTLIAAIPSCALDEAGRLEQYARYKRLAEAVNQVERRLETVVVEFGERLDRDLLEQTLAIERQCCPFFIFEFEEGEHRLAISVRQPDQRSALDAMAAAFAPVQQTSNGPGGGS